MKHRREGAVSAVAADHVSVSFLRETVAHREVAAVADSSAHNINDYTKRGMARSEATHQSLFGVVGSNIVRLKRMQVGQLHLHRGELAFSSAYWRGAPRAEGEGKREGEGIVTRQTNSGTAKARG